jgi:hypothetical protein
VSSASGPIDLTKRPPPRIARVADVTRRVVGVVVGGLVGAITWLIVMQEGYKRGVTDHDYNRVMGQVFKDATDPDVARTGYRATLVVGVIMAAIFALVVHRWTRDKRGIIAALWFALVPLLAWGLLLAPLVDAYRPTGVGQEPVPIPGGVFGLDGGFWTLPLAMAASLLVSLVIVRSYRLMSTASWWRTRPVAPGEAVHDIVGLADVTPLSLELPEERAEDAGKGSRP